MKKFDLIKRIIIMRDFVLNTDSLYDLVRSRFLNRISDAEVEKNYADFGRAVEKILNNPEAENVDVSYIVELILKAQAQILEDQPAIESSEEELPQEEDIVDQDTVEDNKDQLKTFASYTGYYRDNDSYSFKSKNWENNKLVSSEEKEGFLVDSDDYDQEYITEDDLIYALYLNGGKHMQLDMVKALKDEGVAKDVINRFFVEESPTVEDCKIIIKSFSDITSIDYEVLNKTLFGDQFIFVPLSKFFADIK